MIHLLLNNAPLKNSQKFGEKKNVFPRNKHLFRSSIYFNKFIKIINTDTRFLNGGLQGKNPLVSRTLSGEPYKHISFVMQPQRIRIL